ncbi:hypothetical protein [Providencia hangzhouensis]|uniref:hypothetical protein n=1 Tax=Providencia hangzhouensis TaxID=3031799 RepID=UPI003F4B08F1
MPRNRAALPRCSRQRRAYVHIIISAGGGARFYDHFIKEAFPQARILQSVNPVASNSIGYWHYGVNKLSSQSD